MKRILLLLLVITLFGCTPQDCPTRCDKIQPGENAAHFDEQRILPGGCYWGSLDQKAHGTPDGWVHYKEGTESASWCPPNPETTETCDC